MWKMPDDLRRYDRVIELSRPEIVVEAGTRCGGFAVWLRSRGLRVVTIDVDSKLSQDARSMNIDGIEWIVGSSTSESVVDRVRELTRGWRTMVSLDSDHVAPHVATEIELYGALVTPGCYLAVEDGIFDLMGRSASIGGHGILMHGGPLRAIEQKLVHNEQWRRDEEIEQLTPITHSPAGWWQRVG